MEIIRAIAYGIIIFYGILFLAVIPYAGYAAHQEAKLEREKAEREEKKHAADGRSYGILSNRVDGVEEELDVLFKGQTQLRVEIQALKEKAPERENELATLKTGQPE